MKKVFYYLPLIVLAPHIILHDGLIAGHAIYNVLGDAGTGALSMLAFLTVRMTINHKK